MTSLFPLRRITVPTFVIAGFAAAPLGLARTACVTSGPSAAAVAVGSATAEVYHEMTGDALGGMPVHVIRIDPPDTDGGVQVFTTGRDGRAFLSPLEDGGYEVYVEFNNHRSRSAFFEILPNVDYHPVVQLYFNPDIDPGVDSPPHERD